MKRFILIAMIFIFVGCQKQIRTDSVEADITKSEIKTALESDAVKIKANDSKERAVEKTEIRKLLERNMQTILALEKENKLKAEKIKELENQISNDAKYVKIGKAIRNIIIVICGILFISGLLFVGWKVLKK